MTTGPSPTTRAGPPVRGLSTPDAEALLARHGPNLPARVAHRSGWVVARRALREPLVLVLLAAAVLTSVSGDVPDTAVILVVVCVNTAVSVWQELLADRAVTALSSMTEPTCRVLRDGAEKVLPSEQLVPGDVVLLAEGDVVPADARVLEAASLLVDESSLTGEPAAVGKTAPDGVVWAGTTVVHGRAVLVVLRTGADSALGRIAGMLALDPVATPLQRRLGELSRLLALVVVALSGVVLALGLARGEQPEVMVLTAISLVVAAVPESLPVVVTLSLALAARRMASHQALVKDLAAVETLGSVTLLATDKTGTLTLGRMTVESMWSPPGVDSSLLLRAMVLCNDATLVGGGPEGPRDAAHLGDPTEVALLRAAEARGVVLAELRAGYPRVAEVPFDSDRRRMTTVHAGPGGQQLVVCKGAPDVVLDPGLLADPAPLLDDARRRCARLAAGGARVLAVAQGMSPPDAQDPALWEQGLRLLGLVALNDPPRESAAEVLRTCASAGIRVVLVTGDAPETAVAVASAVGLPDGGPAADLSRCPQEELGDALGHSVLARATPGQKLAAVRGWQELGHVVAMTGDGVNDGPALRRADIGVAMGRRGTDVARQAADLVLADDELATVVRAVEEGRRVYANIRRFLLYALSGGAAELLVMLAGPAVGMPLPLLPAQILWVNLLTHSLAGTALGAEPAEVGALARRPRDPGQGVLGGGLGWWVLVVAGWLAAGSLAAALLVGDVPAQERSVLMLTLGAGQLGVALGARTVRRRPTGPAVALAPRNLAQPLSIVGAAALLAGAVLLPPLHAVLATTAVPGSAWWLAAAVAASGAVAARAVVSRGV